MRASPDDEAEAHAQLRTLADKLSLLERDLREGHASLRRIQHYGLARDVDEVIVLIRTLRSLVK